MCWFVVVLLEVRGMAASRTEWRWLWHNAPIPRATFPDSHTPHLVSFVCPATSLRGCSGSRHTRSMRHQGGAISLWGSSATILRTKFVDNEVLVSGAPSSFPPSLREHLSPPCICETRCSCALYPLKHVERLLHSLTSRRVGGGLGARRDVAPRSLFVEAC